MMSRVSPVLQGHLAMLAFSALVAGSFSLGSMMANDISPVAFTAVRFWIGTACVGLLVWHQGGIARGTFKASWRYLVLGGLFAGYFTLMFEGLKDAPPVSAAAIFTFVPLMSAAFAWVLLRQILTRRMTLALGIGAIGALWVIFRGNLSALLAFDIGRGEAIYFIGTISHALYTPMVRFLNRGEGVLMFSFGTMLAGAIAMTAYGAPAIVQTDWTVLPAMVWVTLFYVAIFASAVTVVLLQFASLRLPSAKVMAYTYLTPSWVIIWELALGHSNLTFITFGGICLTVIALALLLRDEDVPQPS